MTFTDADRRARIKSRIAEFGNEKTHLLYHVDFFLHDVKAMLDALEQAESDRDSWKAQYLIAIGQTTEQGECEHGQGD